jgi:hypothetical protein
MYSYKDEVCEQIETLQKPPAQPQQDDKPATPAPQKKIIRAVNRQIAFPAKKLENSEDVDAYVEKHPCKT